MAKFKIASNRVMWYMVFPIPFLCVAFLRWELYGAAKMKKFFQNGLCSTISFTTTEYDTRFLLIWFLV
jgi:hypothetical protein